jgi:hypothetical protein
MSDTEQPPRWANSIPPGRTATGAFAKGNRIATGNPNTKRMSELRKQILAATTEEQVTEVMGALYREAIKGDVPACTTWLKYTVGPPPQAIEISTGEPIKVDMDNLTTLVLTALGPHPEARQAVALALRSANQPGVPAIEPPTEGAGNGHAD